MNTKPNKVIARFSCGAASAVATKLALSKYGNRVEIFYNDTNSEHPDNVRFMSDCERWFGAKVNVLKSDKYLHIWDVFEKKRFLSSQHGAPCTSELKRIPGEAIWNFGDIEIFGYTADESHRLERFKKDNKERIIECPLIDRGLSKEDCLALLQKAGIELPAMYKLGFRNNNCIGCVKARDSIDYWKRVRKHFPTIYNRMAGLERSIGITINRRTKNGIRKPVFLDEIEPGDPVSDDPQISCGLFCIAESEDIFNHQPERTVTNHAQGQERQEEEVTLHRPGHQLSVAGRGKGVAQ